MPHMHWVARQNKLELPNDEEEVNTWDIHKCDGQAHDPDTMAVPLTPKPTRGLVVELEHPKIKTRLTNEKFASVKGECEI